MLEGKFKLYDNLKDIFDPKNKNQEYENIFEIQFKHSGSWGLEGSIQHSYWGPRNVGGPTNFGGWGGFGPTQYLYDSYDNNDKRKKHSSSQNMQASPRHLLLPANSGTQKQVM